MRLFSLCSVLLGLTVGGLAAEEPIKVKVVVVAMFEAGEDTGDRPGEFQYWVEREGLTEVIPFPQGYRDLRSTPNGELLGVVTGVGTAKSAATIMALGLDPRFDLTEAYWLVAGISGVDPTDMSLGSAAWAEWLVDGDLGHEIDFREVPEGWETGYIPLRKARPYQQPVDGSEGQVFRLVPSLVEWAYQLTKDTELMDTEAMANKRALYEGYPVAQRPPFVLKGDQLAAMTYWHGEILNEWANKWVDYYTEGQGEFVTSAMEDTGTYNSLSWLDRAGKVDVKRLLVLRTASNFSMQWPGGDAAESLSGEKLGPGYSAYFPSLDAAHRVGSKVVHALLEGWETYRTEMPGAEK
ncbi:purine nucleoside permease [Actomonas aquatica]|uniref:Purine nucleoside permease n=1 Tax=Actomonas aquatica TaxID=2866162 RepID=A0ABZ1CFK7_9BACT|nr:purine nucleoside permease [Opitutus sp. WL0086]WRQ89349.1 purine nucleoside permease [Opitutus sp. WL0086]